MNAPVRSPLTLLIQRFLPRLRYPYLVLILGGLLLLDLVVPDPLPLVDELMLAILTFVAASFATRREERPPPRDVTPPDEPERTLSAGDDPPSQSQPPR